LRKIEVLTINGKILAQACKDVGMVELGYFRWRKIYGGISLKGFPLVTLFFIRDRYGGNIRMLTKIDEFSRRYLTIF
jgi:hypothetical protein